MRLVSDLSFTHINTIIMELYHLICIEEEKKKIKRMSTMSSLLARLVSMIDETSGPSIIENKFSSHQ